jgi:uncharacterized membrane protein SpoIIM required for sporulation
MTPDEFVLKRHSAWRELESLLGRADQRLSDLTETELAALGKLYRQATSDLALAQRDYPADRVTRYLNQLVARAHPIIYRRRATNRRQFVTFYTTTFPRIYRRLWPYTLASLLLFALPALFAFLAVWRQPDFITSLVGSGIQGLVERVEAGEMWTEIAPNVRSAGASLIFTNNIQVMFLTFAGGVTAGLLTAWLLLTNGVSFGAIFGLLQSHAMSQHLVDFVAAHGFVELSVIFLAGGCGLYIADGLLRPGLLSRSANLSQRATVAVKAILGCVPLLVMSGLIEGFISPSALPTYAKLAIGLLTGLALHGYWWLAGRGTAFET